MLPDLKSEVSSLPAATLTQGKLPRWIDSREDRTTRISRILCWVITICAGLVQAWAARFTPSADATNYLDMASALLRGDWKNAVNAYWSPFFSWLLAFALEMTGSKPYWESTLLQLVNFVGLLVALRSFEFFFRAFLCLPKCASSFAGEEEGRSRWWILGYGLFLSTAFFVQSATTTTPDVWASVFAFLTMGLILRIAAARSGSHLFALLGLTLGFAYLTKAFYFPMAFVFLATAFLATRSLRNNIKPAALALGIFFLVSGPWIAALSYSKHRLTFGDVGRLAYVKIIDQIPNSLAWQGENGTGVPRHPVRQLWDSPTVYEFATPIGGTYPPAFDWSYWMEGARPRFHLRGQLKVLRQSVGTFFLILQSQIEYLVGLLVLFFLACAKPTWTLAARRQWYLWISSLIACLSYAIVLVEGRYVAPFIIFLWVAVFSCFFEAASQLPRRVAFALVLAMVSVTGLRLAKSVEATLTGASSTGRNVDWEASQALRALGTRPGDKVAAISAVSEVEWARLAGLTVVSEVPFGQEGIFWSADSDTKRKVFELFSQTGATIVVTKQPLPSAVAEGWTPLGSTGFYAHPLPDTNSNHP